MIQKMLMSSGGGGLKGFHDSDATALGDTINVGFEPKYIMLWGNYNANTRMLLIYDSDQDVGTTKYVTQAFVYQGQFYEQTQAMPYGINSITSTGFTVGSDVAAMTNWQVIAVG